ncbi:MAG: hypothetical protein WCR46_05725 [Deltaproteobacteria bacterium]
MQFLNKARGVVVFHEGFGANFWKRRATSMFTAWPLPRMARENDNGKNKETP